MRAKNLLSVLMHCYAIAALASVMWVAVLYTMSFDDQGGDWLGGFGKTFLEGVGLDSVTNGIPETVDDVLPHEPTRQWVLLTRLINAAPRATVN